MRTIYVRDEDAANWERLAAAAARQKRSTSFLIAEIIAAYLASTDAQPS
jgi:hypothetical protein